MTGCDPRRLDRQALGRAGEDAAAQFLTQSGYRILARNVRAGGVELDVIARRGTTLAIVEVKTRRSLRRGRAEEAVDAHKQARLVRGAQAWIHQERPRTRRIRFDVITCEPTATGFRVQHWPAAFDASD